MTRNPEVPTAKSLVDYILRYLAMEFVPGYRAAHAPARPTRKIEARPTPSAPLEDKAPEAASPNNQQSTVNTPAKRLRMEIDASVETSPSAVVGPTPGGPQLRLAV